jgi:hypothetical protein
MTEQDYPYLGVDGECRFNKSRAVTRLRGFSYATTPCYKECDKQDEETLLRNLVQHAPVSICINANIWQVYQSGVIERDCPQDYRGLNHCASIVGFGRDNGRNDGTSESRYWVR